MSIFHELEQFGGRIGADVERFVNEGKQQLEQHVTEHPQPLFDLLREVKPVLLIHDIAIVTRYEDVVSVLTNDGTFGVEPYTGTMTELAGDFILGLNESPEYERDVSILRLAAPRSDVPTLSDFVADTARELVGLGADAGGTVNVADLAKRVPARLIGRWFGTPGPDEDSMIAWTLAMFEDIFVNVKHDPQIHLAAVKAASELRPYLAEAIAERKRADGPPGDTVVDRLIGMQAVPATAFSDEDIATSLIGLVVGFIPTIATATTFAIDALLDRPDALRGAQAAAEANDVDTVRAYMWEAMRFAPQGPGLLRRATSDFVVGEGTMHATKVAAGTVTFAATESAMLDGTVVDDPDEFRVGRPAHHYLHFGAGLHECFGRFANAMQIPLIAMALLARPNLARAAGDDGRLVKTGPYPQSLIVTV
jgi:cytochrome P450